MNKNVTPLMNKPLHFAQLRHDFPKSLKFSAACSFYKEMDSHGEAAPAFQTAH